MTKIIVLLLIGYTFTIASNNNSTTDGHERATCTGSSAPQTDTSVQRAMRRVARAHLEILLLCSMRSSSDGSDGIPSKESM